MPPKKQINREDIIMKAFELVRKNGFQSITARMLAKAMSCSTQPIYQEFRDMNELKNVLAEKALTIMLQYMNSYSTKEYAPSLAKIVGYVQFANEEPYLFQLIYSSEVFGLEKAKELTAVKDELELNMLIYAHGMIMMKAFGTLTLKWEQIREMIVNAYECFKGGIR